MRFSAPRFLPSSDYSWSDETDVVILGSGAAGLSAALAASKCGWRVTVISKGILEGGSTAFAQGGMAAVTDPEDSTDLHLRDTLVAGAGLSDERAVRTLVEASPKAVRLLSELGARFDPGQLGLEGGHSRRRIVHAGGDAIGAELHRTLRAAVLASPVKVMENTAAIDVVRDDEGRVVGVIVGRRGRDDEGVLKVGVVHALAVVLATGGFGQAYPTSTNPREVTGDGLAMAARAGAEMTNIEFVQFHPTVFYVPGALGQSPLITEALRGAGAVIVDAHGNSVMRGVHPLADLAPRDVVAYAMTCRMSAGDGPSTHLWLDARDLGPTRLASGFPTFVENCRGLGFDPAAEAVPVAPGAHYACGGVRTDLDGATSVPGLYAVGEVANTGIHGANRLASNSLTEAVVFGRRLGLSLGGSLEQCPAGSSPLPASAPVPGLGVDPASRAALADAMSRHAGVLRSRDDLEVVLDLLAATPGGDSSPMTLALLEATNLHTVSLLVASAALLREESRGCHRRSDFASPSEHWARELTMRVLDGELVADARAWAEV